MWLKKIGDNVGGGLARQVLDWYSNFKKGGMDDKKAIEICVANSKDNFSEEKIKSLIDRKEKITSELNQNRNLNITEKRIVDRISNEQVVLESVIESALPSEDAENLKTKIQSEILMPLFKGEESNIKETEILEGVSGDLKEELSYGLENIKLVKKTEETAAAVINSLKANEKLVVAVGQSEDDLLGITANELREIVLEENGKNQTDKFLDISRRVTGVLENKGLINEELTTEINSKVKAAGVEMQEWKQENETKVTLLRGINLKKKIEKEMLLENTDLSDSEKESIRDYSNLIRGVYTSATNIDKEIAGENTGEAGTDLKGLVYFLKTDSREVGKFLSDYSRIKDGLGRLKMPDAIRESRSMARIMQMMEGSEKFKNMVMVSNKAVHFYERIGGWGGRLVGGRIGNQVASEFAKESIKILSQHGSEKGMMMILRGVLSGGVNAATASTTVVGGSVAAGGLAAAQAIPVAGQVALIATLAVIAAKKIFSKISDFLGKIGNVFNLNFSSASGQNQDDLKEGLAEMANNLGNFSLKLAGLIVMMPAALAAIPVGGMVSLVIVIFMAFFFAYSVLNTNLLSSLVPPRAVVSTIDSANFGVGYTGPLTDDCPSNWPVDKGLVTKGPLAAGSHNKDEAVDIGLGGGNPVYATHKGMLVQISQPGGCGYGATIWGTCNGVRFRTVYCHFPKLSINEQMAVDKDQIIGLVDTTGNSTGNHIHYSLKLLGKINDYLPRRVPEYCVGVASCGNISVSR